MGALKLSYYHKVEEGQQVVPIFNLYPLGQQHAALKNRVNCSPFGVTLHGRDLSLSTTGNVPYNYGFNGKIKDDEIKDGGNSYDFGARMYDPRVGRFMNLDQFTKEYPYYSPYIFAGNMPIWAIDNNGDSVWVYSEAVGTGSVGRHMFMRVKTKDIDVIIELGGPHGNSKVGQPKVYAYSDANKNGRENIQQHLVYEPINSSNPEKFENDILAYANYFVSQNVYKKDNKTGKDYVASNPLLPDYNMFGPNSNGFIRALIVMAGGHLAVPEGWQNNDNSLLTMDCLPGADWGNMKPYMTAISNYFGQDEYFQNTFGMSMAEFVQKKGAAKKIENSKGTKTSNPVAPADNTKVAKQRFKVNLGIVRKKLKLSGSKDKSDFVIGK